ncbi:MAG TPA: hypothetical protein PK385_06875 [Spirochaetota bacterium]|nr:hypothetical protein [Spirochaetota bacterium]HOS33308.1 hypothetical protein [Spirochaetota bacterium]HOS55766.1 hypothetical protein [Spirochaetota bacterium]HPK61158.1 hypothetical protein [Spirochaetota bacterium]HQF76722.1 hypothetical protein [Spirochaetota bacterium]
MIFPNFISDWDDSLLRDSEITLYIKDDIRNFNEFYKISSVNSVCFFNAIINSNDKEKKISLNIENSVYKNIWSKILEEKTSLIKSIYVFSSGETVSYLFTFRYFDKIKKSSGIGNIFQKDLLFLYNSFKKISDM